MTTTKALFVFTAALVSPAVASANPHSVAVLDFDGPRALADSGKAAVVSILADKYTVVSSRNWLDAKGSAGRKLKGKAAWAKASKAAGVDALVEGWVQDEGRNKVLTVVITDASNGDEKDELTIKLPSKGFTADVNAQVRKGIEDRFEYIDAQSGGNPDPLPTYNPRDDRKIGAKRPADDLTDDRDSRRDDRRTSRRDDDRDDRDDRRTRRRDDDRDDRDDRRTSRRDDDDVTEKEPKRIAKAEQKETKQQKEDSVLVNVFRPTSEEEEIVIPKVAHVPQPTPKAMISGGFYMSSRSLSVTADNQEGVTDYAGVPNKGIQVGGAYYPFPTKKIDGVLSGVGFSFGLQHSIGSVVTFADDEAVSDFVINQSAWNAGIHYRQPLGSGFAIDGEIGYGQSKYTIEDAPMTFEVPDTAYSFLTAGGHLDLKITEKSTVGFGAKYLYTLGQGDLTSTDWYGPGSSSGWHLDANFVIPLPKNLYVEGAFTFTRIKTSFDGVGQITEDEGATEATDSSIAGNVKVGISF